VAERGIGHQPRDRRFGEPGWPDVEAEILTEEGLRIAQLHPSALALDEVFGRSRKVMLSVAGVDHEGEFGKRGHHEAGQGAGAQVMKAHHVRSMVDQGRVTTGFALSRSDERLGNPIVTRGLG